jgi:hypothetical protein
MNRLFRVTGFTACFLAVLLASGGHWAVVQSVAWARMIVVYSRDNSLAEAIAMTFSGRHPCKMCRQIQKARQAEEQAPPLVNWGRQPEFLLAGHRVAVPRPGITDAPLVMFVLDPYSDFLPAPPKPPPRAA